MLPPDSKMSITRKSPQIRLSNPGDISQGRAHSANFASAVTDPLPRWKSPCNASLKTEAGWLRWAATLLGRRSIRIAVGMALVPGPGGGDYVFELWVFGLPSKFIHGPVRRGYQPGRVPGPARLFDGRNRLARHLLARPDDLADRVTVAVAQVVEAVPARRQAEDVRLGQVEDVDVIADAGAVGRGVVGAVDFAMRLPAQGDLQHVRDEMRLDAMVLAEPDARAGGVEVAACDELQPVSPLIPQEHFLEHQFRFAIRVDRALEQIFGHGHAVGRAVGGAGRTEDELLHGALHCGVEQLH